MADSAALTALHTWMRSQVPPVLHARLGDAELWLSPSAPEHVTPDEQPLDEAAAHRRAIETLLYSSGADPTPFLRVGGQ